jgi:thioredoxin 1
MASPRDYTPTQPVRRDIDALPGAAVLEFGTNWCGFCRASQPVVDAALAKHPQVRHLKVEDGKGYLLGRSFGVKLWPTLVFLRDGREVTRLVRPRDAASINDALARIDPR